MFIEHLGDMNHFKQGHGRKSLWKAGLNLYPIYRHCKILVICPGLIQLVRAFGWAYKCVGGLYPKELVSGMKKTFPNELIRNMMKLACSSIKNRFPFTGFQTDTGIKH